MKIIDFEKKGNVVRFYLGENNLDYWYGDDWNDRPYEHNAGTVYEEFISGIMDVVFPYSSSVLEPKDDWRYQGNSPFCKDDMRDRQVPCIIVIPQSEDKYSYVDEAFSLYMGSANIPKFYFGDKDLESRIIPADGKIISSHTLTYNKEDRTLYDEEGKEFRLY